MDQDTATMIWWPVVRAKVALWKKCVSTASWETGLESGVRNGDCSLATIPE